MSNIFDALKKKQGTVDTSAAPAPAVGPFPVRPAGQTAVAQKKEMDFHLSREIGSLAERIESELPRSGRRIIAVAGAVPGEGASTICLHLARVLSRKTDGKILLIDADFARATRSLSQSIGKSAELPGLADVLSGQVELSNAILSTDETNLHFLPSGLGPGRTPDLLVSDRMRQFLDDIGQLYRAVILDCAAILNHPEYRSLGGWTDGLVLVVRAHRTRREVVQKALTLLQGARVRLIGIVLNARKYPIPDFLYRRL